MEFIFKVYSLADKVFPTKYKPVSAFLESVTERWQEIARELGLSEQTIHRIHQAHQGNSELCCQQMIEECLVGTEVKMRWHSLTEALRKLKLESLADNIDLDWGKQIYIYIYMSDSLHIILFYPLIMIIYY